MQRLRRRKHCFASVSTDIHPLWGCFCKIFKIKFLKISRVNDNHKPSSAWKAATILTVGWAERNLRKQPQPANRLKGGTKKVSPFRRIPFSATCRKLRHACIRLWLSTPSRRFFVLVVSNCTPCRAEIVRKFENKIWQNFQNQFFISNQTNPNLFQKFGLAWANLVRKATPKMSVGHSYR